MDKRIKKRRLRPDHPDAQVRRGPREAAGKMRVAQNARRHGLSLPVLADEGFCAEIDELARRICGPAAVARVAVTLASPACDPELFYLAQRVAEAQVDVMRVRRARLALVAGNLADRGASVPSATADADLHQPEHAEKVALILAAASADLVAMDRCQRAAAARIPKPRRPAGGDFGRTISGDKPNGIKAIDLSGG